jgi:uncharacterized protein (TIGR03437 family)
MKQIHASPRAGLLVLWSLLALSLFVLAATDHWRVTALSTAPTTMQAGGNCTGFGFTYGRGFAPDPATQERPIAVVSGDFNQDGKTDLAAANLFGNSISVLPGDGAGGFGMANNLPVVTDGNGFPAGLAVGDFDGDTKLDLAVAIAFNPGRVFVLSGNGAGNFAVTGMLNAGVDTAAVAVADFNGDSRADIAAVNKGDTVAALPGTVSVFLNNGSGGFGTATTLTPGMTPVALAVGEFTGDTNADIAVVNSGSNNVSLFANTGSGAFGAATNFAVGTNPNGIVAGFFNNDTRLDLAIANTGNDNVSILFANGSGGFGAATNFAGGTTPYALVTNDFNGDSKADLGISNGFANQASVLLNNGSGGFGAPQTTAVGSQPLSLASGDFNADTKADLAVANSASNNISILLGKGDGTFGGTTFLFTNPQAVAISDFNKDGRADLAVANFGGDKITIFLADNTGSYSVPQEFNVGIKPIAMTTGDFNADGNVDVAVANNGANNVSILLGNGAGSFAAATNFTAGTQPASIASGDFNKDGKLDLITANDSGNDVTLLVGQGNGTFAAPSSFAAGTRPTSIDVDDFNADGNLDVVVANLDSTFVSLLLGNGTGSFTAGTNINLPASGKGVAVTTNDLNNDGKTDLVVALNASTNLAIALGNGDGTFAAATAINAGGTNPSEVIVNDFDGDAKADLAVTLSGNNYVALLRGNGDGTFEAAKTFVTGTGPISLDDGDLNNDSRVDLAVVNTNSNSLTLLLNTCANTPPRITPAAALTRTQGGTASHSTIASVSDLETAAGSLTVMASAPAGVTVSDITNTNGTITANVAVSCATALGNQTVSLEVTDGNGLTATAMLTINVTANTAPVLGTYTGLEVVSGAARNFAPSAAPADNGTVQTITAIANTAGFTGTFSLDPATGVLTVNNAAPVGTYDLTLTATDNCGLTATRNAQLKVVAPLVITALDPATRQAQSDAFTLMVNGSGFTANSKVWWNGSARATTFVSATKLSAAILATDLNLNAAGSANVSVSDPVAGGLTSNTVAFTITAPNPVPTITLLDPVAAIAGDPAFTLTINGSNFLSNSVVKFNGTDRTTTFVSTTQLTINVTAAEIANSGSITISVFNPAPGGGTSNAVSLPINNPVPTLASLSPNAAFKGDPAFLLTVTGTNFVPTSVVRWNGANRATTFVSATQLQAAILASDLAAEGMIDVTVFNPTPAGGTSSSVKFAVNLLTGYEADLSPRPRGDNKVSIADWVLVGRLASGLDAVQDSSEFQRADCAPLATFGDGRITIADWVQAGRFAVGLDPLTPAQGPSRPATSFEAAAWAEAQGELTRIVRARSRAFTRGELNALPLELDAQGNENGLSFSLQFDPKRLLFSHAVAPNGWSVNVNAEQSKQGKLGVMLALSAGTVAPQGSQPLVYLYFAPLGGTEVVTTDITFDDQVFARDIADVNARLLPRATYEKATVTIQGRGITNVRAASYVGPEVASNSIASAFGVELATEAAAAVTSPLPERLAGTSVNITDSAGVTKAAALFFVSPTQVNYLLPAGLAEGFAQVTITNRNGVTSRGTVLIHAIAPSVFTADATGQGVAAADVVRVRSNGQQLWERTYRYDASTQKVVAVPIDLGSDSDRVYLILYGTGWRQRAALSQVQVKLGDLYVQPEYAAKQGDYAGLDQLNVSLPRQLIGRGDVNVEVLVNGHAANAVKVTIR